MPLENPAPSLASHKIHQALFHIFGAGGEVWSPHHLP